MSSSSSALVCTKSLLGLSFNIFTKQHKTLGFWTCFRPSIVAETRDDTPDNKTSSDVWEVRSCQTLRKQRTVSLQEWWPWAGGWEMTGSREVSMVWTGAEVARSGLYLMLATLWQMMLKHSPRDNSVLHLWTLLKLKWFQATCSNIYLHLIGCDSS